MKSEPTTLELELPRPYSVQVLANLQSMTNGNTVVSYRLTTSELVATCTFRLISEVPSRQRAQEGAGERAIKTLPSLVRKCADNVVVSIHVRYVVVVARI